MTTFNLNCYHLTRLKVGTHYGIRHRYYRKSYYGHKYQIMKSAFWRISHLSERVCVYLCSCIHINRYHWASRHSVSFWRRRIDGGTGERSTPPNFGQITPYNYTAIEQKEGEKGNWFKKFYSSALLSPFGKLFTKFFITYTRKVFPPLARILAQRSLSFLFRNLCSLLKVWRWKLKKYSFANELFGNLIELSKLVNVKTFSPKHMS